MSSSEAAKDLNGGPSDFASESTMDSIDAAVPSVSAVATLAAPVSSAPVVDPGNAWQVLQVRTRLDAESQPELMMQIHEALAEGCSHIALDLTQNQFFSLAGIQLCMGLARDLAGDGGALALVGCNERTKKHFDVYGSLRQITVVRTMTELVNDRKAAVVIRPRSSRESR